MDSGQTILVIHVVVELCAEAGYDWGSLGMALVKSFLGLKLWFVIRRSLKNETRLHKDVIFQCQSKVTTVSVGQ